jgi:hypothetical protein
MFFVFGQDHHDDAIDAYGMMGWKQEMYVSRG